MLNGIRDKTLLDHLRRRQPTTLTELREAINAEVAITALSPTFQPGTATIAKIDGRDSNEKATPPCSFCQDKKHSTSQCRKLTAHWEQRAKLAKQQLQEAKKQGGGGGRTYLFIFRHCQHQSLLKWRLTNVNRVD